MQKLGVFVGVLAVLVLFAADAQETKVFTFQPPTQWVSGAPLTPEQILRHVLTCTPMPADVDPVVPAGTVEFSRRFPPGSYTCWLQTRARVDAASDSQISDPSNSVVFSISQPIQKPQPPVSFSLR